MSKRRDTEYADLVELFLLGVKPKRLAELYRLTEASVLSLILRRLGAIR